MTKLRRDSGFLILLFFSLLSAPAAAGPVLGDTPDRARVGITLEGVIVSRNTGSSMAVLKELGSGRSVMLKVGDEFKGFTLLRVLGNGIVLEKNTRRYRLFMTSGRPPKFSSGDGLPTEPELPSTPHIFPEGESEIEERTFSRSEVRRIFQDEMPRIMRETRFMPYSEEGRVVGFKLIRIPLKSPLAAIGLRPDDIVLEINGVTLDSVSTVLALYAEVRNADRIQLRLKRGGETRRLIYILK